MSSIVPEGGQQPTLQVQELIASYKLGKLQLMPGCDEEQSLEHDILGVLNQIRTTASEVRSAGPCHDLTIALLRPPLPHTLRVSHSALVPACSEVKVSRRLCGGT